MPITISRTDKPLEFKPFDSEEFIVNYRRISDRSIIRCMKKVLGDSIDLADLNMDTLKQMELIELSTELMEQAITGWSGLYENVENGKLNEVEFSTDLIESLPIPVKIMMGGEIMNLLNEGNDLFALAEKQQKTSGKNRRSAKRTNRKNTKS